MVSAPKISVKFYSSYGRSWVSAVNQQAIALIPLISYRGVQLNSASTLANAAPAGPWFSMACDDMRRVYEYFDAQLFPSATGANSIQRNFWFNVKRASMDLSMTNTGSAETPISTNCPIEYEVYMIWPRKVVTDVSVNMNTASDWITQARIFTENTIGAQGLFAAIPAVQAPGDPAWKVTTNARVNKYVGSKLLGRGYIQVGETVRMHKNVRVKGFTTQEKWFAVDEAVGQANMPMKRGQFAALMVVWRGTPVSSNAAGGFGRSRLTFNCNKEIDVSCPGNGQAGPMDSLLLANSYA